MITIQFEFESAYGTFRDAIALPDDHNYTEAEIDAIKMNRFNNWLDVVSVPSEEEEPEVTIDG